MQIIRVKMFFFLNISNKYSKTQQYIGNKQYVFKIELFFFFFNITNFMYTYVNLFNILLLNTNK